jgi:hypothetical protein
LPPIPIPEDEREEDFKSDDDEDEGDQKLDPDERIRHLKVINFIYSSYS